MLCRGSCENIGRDHPHPIRCNEKWSQLVYKGENLAKQSKEEGHRET